jgi:hypothetical protein
MEKELIGYQYLDKFFDLQFTLREIDIENYIKSLNIINIYSREYFDTCSKEVCIQFKFSLRQINRYFNLISIIYNYINLKENINDTILSKYILFPIILGIKIYDINLYNKIINGQGEDKFKSIIINNTELVKVFNNFFNGTQNEKELDFNFSEMYRKIFIEFQTNEWLGTKIGIINIEHAKERKKLMSLLSFLNEFVKL